MESISRRQVLQAGGAAALAPAFRHFPRLQDQKVGWAILGLGGYATNQIMPAFKDCEHAKIVALISGTPEKLVRYGEQYGIPESARYSYDGMDAIRNNPEIQVVYVITPPGTHRKFVERAAGLGKHVTSEKPMAPTAADCQAMIDACKKAGKLLQIGYRSHYEATNRRAIEMCRSGELGTIRSVTSDHGFSAQPGTWRLQKDLAGGGSMMDIGIYAVQALQYLAGEEPTEVFARIDNLPNDPRFREVEDTVHFSFAFPSGHDAQGVSSYSWSGANQYRVIGTKGKLEAEPATSYSGNRLTFRGREVPVTPNNQFAAQLDHMSEAILGTKPVITPGEMGKRDIRIIEAIYESGRTGRPVKLR